MQEVAESKRNLQERSEVVDKTVEQVQEHSDMLNMVIGNQTILDLLTDAHGEKAEKLISSLKEKGVDISKTKEEYTGQVKDIQTKLDTSESGHNLLIDIFEVIEENDLKASDWKEIQAAAKERQDRTGVPSTPEEAFDRWKEGKEKVSTAKKYEKIEKENEKLKADAEKGPKPKVPNVLDKSGGADNLKPEKQKLKGISLNDVKDDDIDTTKF